MRSHIPSLCRTGGAESAPLSLFETASSGIRLLAILDESDLLVLPSKVEGFGTIALEAMARRINVLVSPACGLLDWPLPVGSVFVQGAEESPAEAIHRIEAMGKETRIRSALRACGNTCCAINRIQIRTARALDRPIRIAVHPDDFNLKSARDPDRLFDPSPASFYSSLALSSACSYCSNNSDIS